MITAHPSVREACAISVPDPRWGETVKAVVVLEPGSSASAAEIREWCHQRLAGFKRPRFVQFLEYEQVPRSTTGKILRHELELAMALCGRPTIASIDSSILWPTRT